MDDLFQNPNDKMEVEPSDLGPAYGAALTICLAKKLAAEFKKPWTDKQESDMQVKIAALVAAASALGLKTIQVIVTRPNGEKVSRIMDIDRINKTRSLQ